MRVEKVGQRVYAIRNTLALSPSDFADSLGLDRSLLSRIERGKEGLSIANGVKIADRFGFGLDFIYRGVLSDVPQAFFSRIQTEVLITPAMRKGPDTDVTSE